MQDRIRHATALGALLVSNIASAFCGFYVAGADAKLFNNATSVVLMRDGTRTVLSMQNNYQGPPQNFAMVVPVPVVLQKENVKTLPREVFAHVDQLAAPRLVEYWEQDPCYFPPPMAPSAMARMSAGAPMPKKSARAESLGVTIEAQFTVGEYEIVILSAKDSNGLDTWLREEKYKVPQGAEPLLRPYVRAGMKFFVAKVDVSKVKFEGDQAMLSPLRFHYDTETFSLPVRLGLMNSSGTQDLLVHILARNQRYEVANYPNVTIPTNIDLADEAKGQFPAFYAALFDKTLEKHPGAVVTEYSWQSMSCDPCPGPPLDLNALATLGADVLPGGAAPPGQRMYRGRLPPWGGGMNGFVLTRLHARYAKESLGEDLVFRAAPPIVGGREFMQTDGHLEKGARPDAYNNFQGRYAIRHPWTGPISCENPRRGMWGGPPGSGYGAPPPAPTAVRDVAFAPRGKIQLASIVRQDIPEVDVKASALPVSGSSASPPAKKSACAGMDVTNCSATDGCVPRFGPSCPTCSDHVYLGCEGTR
jgi:hypothetical protein